MASELNQLWRPHLVHTLNDFRQATMIKFLEDARICWSEWYSRCVKQQRVLFNCVCEVLCKAVTVVKKLVEVRMTS